MELLVFNVKFNLPKAWAARKRTIATKMLHPFFGNFKSVASANSEIKGKPEAKRNGKRDHRTVKIITTYCEIRSITFFSAKTSSEIFWESCMISVLKRRPDITHGAKYQAQCFKVFKEKNL